MKDFFKQVFSSCLGTLIALGVISTLSFSALVALIALFASQEGTTKPIGEGVLIIDQGMILQDRDPSSSLGEFFAGDLPPVMSLRDVIESIRAAADDDDIVALLLDGRRRNVNGYASLREIRNALEEFKATGKEIYAYDVDLLERDYYLASIADEIWLNPFGVMELNGLGAEQLFLTGALEQYGIGVQIVRAGAFKSAVEPFTETAFSPENREQTEALLQDLWGEFTTTIASDRPFSASTAQNLADTEGLVPAETAESSELVTRLAYFDELLDQLKTLTNTAADEDLPQISLVDYSFDREFSDFGNFSPNEVALVYAEGGIIDGEGGPDTIGGDSLSRQLRELRLNPDIKAVVLRVNSPGGSAIASEVILRELKLIREGGIPIVVSMGDIAASGGYWIATESDYIFAQPNTITGSIGVFGILPNIETISNNNGLTWDSVETGDLANLGTVSRPKTEAELAIFQTFVNDIYDDFLTRVGTARDMTREEVNAIAQGRIWSGQAAIDINLVDELGGMSEAIAYAAELTELGENYTLQEYPQPQTWEEELFGNLLGVQAQQLGTPFDQEIAKLQESVDLWRSLNDPKQVYALMPWQLDID